MKNFATFASASPAAQLSKAERRFVRNTLNDMLQSPPFRTSRQCQELLRYIVLHSLDGEEESLRERIIGVQVFGRRPDYDQSSDPVVRIRAADVRKRIALYYDQTEARDSQVRVAIPSGSYRATFEVIKPELLQPPTLLTRSFDPGPEPQPAFTETSTVAMAEPPISSTKPSPRARATLLKMRLASVVLFAGVLLSGIATSWIVMYRNTPLRRFWAPVLRDQHHALIYAGGNTMYTFAPDFVEHYLHENHLENNNALNRTLVVHLDPDQTLKGRDILQLANKFVSVGDSATAAKIAGYFAVEAKAYDMRFDQDISVGDLRQQPTILIGAYNNDWTLQLTDNMRFTFGPGLRIQDRTDPSRSWQPKQDLSDDFALVSRVLNSKTGEVVITAAGLGQAGTSAAGEFLTNTKAIQAFIDSAPRGWEKKNLQIVLHTTVINGSPSAPEIVTTAYW